jgi:hypothetical protein
MAQAISGAYSGFENRPGPEAISDPAHARELRRRDHDAQDLSPDGGPKDKLTLLDDSVVDQDVLGDDGAEVGQRDVNRSALGRLAPDHPRLSDGIEHLRVGFILRRSAELGGGQREQIVDAVSGGQVVIQPDFGSARARWQIDVADLCPAALQEGAEPGQGSVDLALGHHVGVEGEVDLSTVERNRLPVGKRRFATEAVGAPPVPHPEEGNAA